MSKISLYETLKKSGDLRNSIKESVQKDIDRQTKGVSSIIETGKYCDVDAMAVTTTKKSGVLVGVGVSNVTVGIQVTYEEESGINVNYKK